MPKITAVTADKVSYKKSVWDKIAAAAHKRTKVTERQNVTIKKILNMTFRLFCDSDINLYNKKTPPTECIIHSIR